MKLDQLWVGALAIMLYPSRLPLLAQDAKQVVQQAVKAELDANRDDQTHWRYLKHEAGGNESVVVETEHGAISRRIKEDGKPVSATAAKADDDHIEKFIHDPSMQQKQ